MTPEEIEAAKKFSKRLLIDRLKEKYELRITRPVFQFWIEGGKVKGKITDWLTRAFK